MIYTPQTKKALRVAFEAHKDQMDKSGLPYVFHPFHLAEQMKDEQTTAAALLHDVVEDSEYTFADLEKMGFDKQVLDVLTLLTHQPEEDYFDYVRKIRTNPIAAAVKKADLKHNSDLSRLDEVTEKDLERVQKYRKALQILEGNEE
ncbi:HD domain-containing protein [Allobaculum mucilyticum]|uniref:HD domain-containing protein n=1 Tax=Allobaculum mucilyticum TaxID=2834459 RepID=UPI001E38D1DB|nr:HD domain-containing protein [Allobaculum mucilyticum]UNT95067.1 HD domain-containing protein [Allobaculum mucilyticum]